MNAQSERPPRTKPLIAWMAIAIVCFAVAFALVALRLGPGKHGEPIVSVRIRDDDRALAYAAAQAISGGSFEEALAALSKTSVPKTVTLALIPSKGARESERYEAIVREAIEAWKEAARGRWRFEIVSLRDDPCLTIAFTESATTSFGGLVARSCMDLDLISRSPRPPARERRGSLTIATRNPVLPREHSRSSLLHLVAKGIGGYLGLGETREAGTLMGPDPHAERAPFQPGPEEIAILENYHRFLAELKEAAAKRRAIFVPLPNLELDATSKHGGEHWQGETVRYEFTIRNTGQAPLELAPLPSCGCTVGTYERVIQPGATSRIVADMNTSGFKGEVEKDLNLATNCPASPKLALKLAAKVKPTFVVEPPEPLSIVLPERGEFKRTLRVRPRRDPATKVLGLRPNASFISGRVVPGRDLDGPFFDVELVFDASVPQGAHSVTITLGTDSREEPTLPLTLRLAKGFSVAPRILYFGTVTSATPSPLIQTVTVSRSMGAFRIKRVSCNDPALSLDVIPLREGHEYRIQATYKGGWAGKKISTEILIETDVAGAPPLRVPVTANIGGASGE